ncbi:Aste57867_25184 [Aphanomyces stellatus]|uniref:Aste57867_25184 protein n=1 Tax=Aphanomyces stellatus TaxID=120398 RepID=A0A485LX13_9STRA|nr:hypothetical protein As57867_025106 [Aphanomyces stellatus]VFU01813.1 Aste57867_25184 [Aphanomyces stellatus]
MSPRKRQTVSFESLDHMSDYCNTTDSVSGNFEPPTSPIEVVSKAELLEYEADVQQAARKFVESVCQRVQPTKEIKLVFQATHKPSPWFDDVISAVAASGRVERIKESGKEAWQARDVSKMQAGDDIPEEGALVRYLYTTAADKLVVSPTDMRLYVEMFVTTKNDAAMTAWWQQQQGNVHGVLQLLGQLNLLQKDAIDDLRYEWRQPSSDGSEIVDDGMHYVPDEHALLAFLASRPRALVATQTKGELHALLLAYRLSTAPLSFRTWWVTSWMDPLQRLYGRLRALGVVTSSNKGKSYEWNIPQLLACVNQPSLPRLHASISHDDDDTLAYDLSVASVAQSILQRMQSKGPVKIFTLHYQSKAKPCAWYNDVVSRMEASGTIEEALVDGAQVWRATSLSNSSPPAGPRIPKIPQEGALLYHLVCDAACITVRDDLSARIAAFDVPAFVAWYTAQEDSTSAVLQLLGSLSLLRGAGTVASPFKWSIRPLSKSTGKGLPEEELLLHFLAVCPSRLVATSTVGSFLVLLQSFREALPEISAFRRWWMYALTPPGPHVLTRLASLGVIKSNRPIVAAKCDFKNHLTWCIGSLVQRLSTAPTKIITREWVTLLTMDSPLLEACHAASLNYTPTEAVQELVASYTKDMAACFKASTKPKGVLYSATKIKKKIRKLNLTGDASLEAILAYVVNQLAACPELQLVRSKKGAAHFHLKPSQAEIVPTETLVGGIATSPSQSPHPTKEGTSFPHNTVPTESLRKLTATCLQKALKYLKPPTQVFCPAKIQTKISKLSREMCGRASHATVLAYVIDRLAATLPVHVTLLQNGVVKIHLKERMQTSGARLDDDDMSLSSTSSSWQVPKASTNDIPDMVNCRCLRSNNEFEPEIGPRESTNTDLTTKHCNATCTTTCDDGVYVPTMDVQILAAVCVGEASRITTSDMYWGARIEKKVRKLPPEALGGAPPDVVLAHVVNTIASACPHLYVTRNAKGATIVRVRDAILNTAAKGHPPPHQAMARGWRALDGDQPAGSVDSLEERGMQAPDEVPTSNHQLDDTITTRTVGDDGDVARSDLVDRSAPSWDLLSSHHCPGDIPLEGTLVQYLYRARGAIRLVDELTIQLDAFATCFASDTQVTTWLERGRHEETVVKCLHRLGVLVGQGTPERPFRWPRQPLPCSNNVEALPEESKLLALLADAPTWLLSVRFKVDVAALLQVFVYRLPPSSPFVAWRATAASPVDAVCRRLVALGVLRCHDDLSSPLTWDVVALLDLLEPTLPITADDEMLSDKADSLMKARMLASVQSDVDKYAATALEHIVQLQDELVAHLTTQSSQHSEDIDRGGVVAAFLKSIAEQMRREPRLRATNASGKVDHIFPLEHLTPSHEVIMVDDTAMSAAIAKYDESALEGDVDQPEEQSEGLVDDEAPSMARLTDDGAPRPSALSTSLHDVISNADRPLTLATVSVELVFESGRLGPEQIFSETERHHPVDVNPSNVPSSESYVFPTPATMVKARKITCEDNEASTRSNSATSLSKKERSVVAGVAATAGTEAPVVRKQRRCRPSPQAPPKQ